MDAGEFVARLRAELIEEYVPAFVELARYSGIDRQALSGVIAVSQLMQRLSDDEVDALATLVRLDVVNVVSTVLGILDGVTSFGQHHDLKLIDSKGQVLSGDLQDLWLEAEESSGQDA